jgi:serine/threonine-protein kinase
VAYWLLTGQPPFAASSSLELLVDHVKTVPQPPSALVETEIPAALEAIIMKCLEKEPLDRYQTAEELKAALSNLTLARSWDELKARQWWELHGLWKEGLTTCDQESQPQPVASA